MSESKKSSGDAGSKKIIDVAHPGKSAPSATSKSVIITNRPIMKDPMVVADSDNNEDDTGADGAVNMTQTAKIRLKPLTEQTIKVKTDQDDGEPENNEVAKPEEAGEEVKIVPEKAPEESAKPDTEPEPESKPAPESKPESKSVPEPDAKPEPEPADADAQSADESDAEDKTDDPVVTTEMVEDIDAKEAEEAAKHEAEIQKLAESKQYYLPVNAVENRRTKRVVFIGILLAILLALAWADVALDAGLIHIGGIKPVTHFFSN